MDTLIDLFCVVDDFCNDFMPEYEKTLIGENAKKYKNKSKLRMSEIMTLLIYFHQMRFRDFKTFYLQYIQKHLKDYFPDLVSYNRFVELMPSSMIPLYMFMNVQSKTVTGIYFVDATTIEVCHVKRAYSNRVFKNVAKKGKSSMGWFFGFKLHLIINDKGEIMAFKVTSATTDDRIPVEQLAKGLTGKIVGDKGYISQALFDKLYDQGLQLITKIKKNMKNKLMTLFDKCLLRKRGIIESVNDQLKNISQIEHSRHRSHNNFIVNLISGLIAYSLQPKKPSLKSVNKLAIS
jgi:hypothetical protein